MKRFLEKAFGSVQGTVGQAVGAVPKQFRIIREMIGNLPYVASFVAGKKKDTTAYDEKHYFIIPYRLAEIGYALHSLRFLPKDIPPINDLPKRRFFHVPDARTDELDRQLLNEEAKREFTKGQPRRGASQSGQPLKDLADQIDKVDGRLTKGMLLIGGLVAFANPAVGVALAAHAVLPGLAGAVSKFGLRNIGDRLNQAQLNKEIRTAQKRILSEFKGSTTVKVENPVLKELELSLNTDETEHDPIMEFDFEAAEFGNLSDQHLAPLTYHAISNQYEEVLKSPDACHEAGLRNKEVRWLGLIRKMATCHKV